MPHEYAAKPKIEIEGVALSPELDAPLEGAVVDLNGLLPDMFVLRFRDPDHTIFERARLRIGAKVGLSAAALGEEPAPLILGEITALEAEHDGTGSHAVVRGFDVSHRLHRGKRTETYLDATDADLARIVARRAGLVCGEIDETPTVHPHVSQVKLTDWEFLTRRARDIGYEVLTGDGKLHFRRPADATAGPAAGDLRSSDPLQLVLGADLEVFRPRLSAAGQVAEVQVRGWDPARKQPLVGSARAGSSSASVQPGPAALAATFGRSTYVAADRPFSSQTEVDVAADALAEEIGCTYAEAEGIARGNPGVRAGSAISIGLAGWPFDGAYMVTAATHVFDERGYRTRFTVSGRHDRSLLRLASAEGTADSERIHGVVIGQVTDADDDAGLGRVKLKFPWLSDEYESDWARVVQAGAGKDRGWVVLPEVNDEVLVAFQHGDVRRPFVIGGLFNGVDRPPLADGHVDAATGAVNHRQFVSRGGHLLRFEDSPNARGVVIQTTDAKQEVTLSATKSLIRIKSDGTVEIEAGGDIKIASARGSLSLAAAAGVTIDGGSGDVAVKGKTIRLN